VIGIERFFFEQRRCSWLFNPPFPPDFYGFLKSERQTKRRENLSSGFSQSVLSVFCIIYIIIMPARQGLLINAGCGFFIIDNGIGSINKYIGCGINMNDTN
jgi:hypothetical protein